MQTDLRGRDLIGDLAKAVRCARMRVCGLFVTASRATDTRRNGIADNQSTSPWGTQARRQEEEGSGTAILVQLP